MKKPRQLLKAFVLSYFVICSIKVSFANEQQNFHQPPIYNLQLPQIQMMVPGSPPLLPQEIIIEAPSPMHIWMPGYWNWQNRWIWIPGQWTQPARPNAEWMEHQWRRHEEGERYRREREEWR